MVSGEWIDLLRTSVKPRRAEGSLDRSLPGLAVKQSRLFDCVVPAIDKPVAQRTLSNVQTLTSLSASNRPLCYICGAR